MSPVKDTSPTSTFEVLHGTAMGTAENRLQIGLCQLAFVDGVLLVETGDAALTLLKTNIPISEVRVIFCHRRLLIDICASRPTTLSLNGSEDDLSAAETYFRMRSVPVSFSR